MSMNHLSKCLLLLEGHNSVCVSKSKSNATMIKANGHLSRNKNAGLASLWANKAHKRDLKSGIFILD